MNSISKNLSPLTIATTAMMLRSASDEVIFFVEGDDDISLFSHSLGIPRSNFISCYGKERLMEVFRLIPCKGIDKGTIFLRDRDHDKIDNTKRDGILLIVSDRYDFEMSLIPNRIFSRIFGEFAKTRSTPEYAADAFNKVLNAASAIGALRLVSHGDGLAILFRDANNSYLNPRSLTIDVEEMVRYFLARSEISQDKRDEIVAKIGDILKTTGDALEIASGKDFLRVLSVGLARHFRCCNHSECTFETLARMVRMAVVQDDFRELRFYPILAEQVESCGMEWKGLPL